MSRFEILTIPTVAAWALPAHVQSVPRPKSLAVLPVLQRGSAWKPQQVERLWDSLVRGLPIGSFLLSPYDGNEDLGAKAYSIQGKLLTTTAIQRPNWHLLDGQQRATAIALGFADLWARIPHPPGFDPQQVLWVDLDPTGGADDCEYVFRLLTRSHPWGYQRRSPKDTLSHRNRRLAIQDIERVRGSTFKLGTLPVEAVPYDAIAPVPLASLFGCLRNANVWQALWSEIERVDERVAWKASQRESLRQLLSAEPTKAMKLLEDGLRRLTTDGSDSYQIGGLVVPDRRLGKMSRELHKEDPIATLFIRVNSAGTVPNSDEMSYSLLKSVWPKCHDLVEGLPYNFLPPAPIVVELATVILARTRTKEKRGAPPMPDLAGFRRLVHGDNDEFKSFPQSFEVFISSDEPQKIISAAARILLLRRGEPRDERTFRLLPAQAVQLANRSRRVFLLFLSWIDSRLEVGGDWLGLDEEAHRRLLGLVTAISWFSQYEEDCVAGLWRYRAELHEPGMLQKIVGEQDGRLRLAPLPPPSLLRTTMEARVTGAVSRADYNTDLNDASNLWNNWRLWSHFSNPPRESSALEDWYSDGCNLPLDRGTEDSEVWRGQAWLSFVKQLKNRQDLVIYAQRKTLSGWFEGYDPTRPDQIEDTDCPWDFDHIFPSYFTGTWYVPQIIKDWHGSIGNLRAWPAELKVR